VIFLDTYAVNVVEFTPDEIQGALEYPFKYRDQWPEKYRIGHEFLEAQHERRQQSDRDHCDVEELPHCVQLVARVSLEPLGKQRPAAEASVRQHRQGHAARGGYSALEGRPYQ